MSEPVSITDACKPVLARVRRQPAATRLRTASDMIDEMTELMAAVARIRRGAVRELRRKGWTLAAVADLIEVTVPRVKQIQDGTVRTPKRRLDQGQPRVHPRRTDQTERERIDQAVRAALEDAGRA
jgi:hypothetical protein